MPGKLIPWLALLHKRFRKKKSPVYVLLTPIVGSWKQCEKTCHSFHLLPFKLAKFSEYFQTFSSRVITYWSRSKFGFWKQCSLIDYYNFASVILNQMAATYANGSLSQQTVDDFIRPDAFGIPGPNICTNLRFDYKMLKWTDNEFTENNNFELKWKGRFGGFWANRENMHPIQPYQPGTSWQI